MTLSQFYSLGLQPSLKSVLPLLVFLALLSLLSGCDPGVPQINSENPKTGEMEPNFLLGDSTPLPGNHKQKVTIVSARPDSEVANSTADQDKKQEVFEPDPENFRVKPNHWVAIQNEGVSKKEDFNGVLTHSMRMGNLRPKAIPGTRYFLRSERPASLAKEQPKKFEAPVFVTPHSPLTVAPDLETKSGVDVVTELDRFLPLNANQYHMVLLTEVPETYRFLTVLPSIWNVRFNRHLQDNDMFSGSEDELADMDFSNAANSLQIDSLYYKLTISDWDDAPELPSNAQQWTSIAYLIWADTFSPDELSDDQKQAIVDWLHFGGQIVISGDAIDMLNDSFLQPYLPVKPTGKENSTGEQMTELVRNWSLEKDTNGNLVSPSFNENDKLVLTTWEKTKAASDISSCAGLVVEKEVGRGRITCIAFPLNYNKLRSWSGLDNWFNSCILRRPGRKFDNLDSFNFMENSSVSKGFSWNSSTEPADQPGFYTNFRFMARDWFAETNYRDRNSGEAIPYDVNRLLKYQEGPRRFKNDNPRNSPGAWDDYSQFASAARETLKDQAGITPPKRDWVLKALLIYLAVLVPGNYIVFRSIGKLEWAWFSIPLISIIGGISVVRAASLDIGFSNKRLQINVVEFVPEFERAHVSGYGSLYSSLTSSFNYASDNPTTLALPFPTANVPTDSDELRPTEFSFQVGKNVKFGPQSVLSNTMEMYHFEQLVSTSGTFQLTSPTSVTNGTGLTLHDAVLMRQDSNSNEIQFARISQLAPEEEAAIQWTTLMTMNQLYDSWKGTELSDLEYELGQILERMATVEQTFVTSSWNDVASFYAESEPAFSEAVRRIAERKQTEVGEVITYDFALEAFKESRLEQKLNLGRFSRIASHYPLGPDEVRMFGWSDDQIHDFEVQPSASQVSNKNFVVVQLKRPALPPIARDSNLAYKPKSQQDKELTPEAEIEGENFSQ